jgi:hypothetical protein
MISAFDPKLTDASDRIAALPFYKSRGPERFMKVLDAMITDPNVVAEHGRHV